MGRFFGTDGVRGVANVAPMSAEMALKLGRATAYVCKRHSKAVRPRIVIGKDTRVSGYMLESALVAGICSMGVDVFMVGPMPTPGVAFITRSMRADAGLVISASHNPYQDNGIKIFSRTGYKLPDAEEDEIEDLITSGRIEEIRPTADKIGKAKRIDDALGRYIVFCKRAYPEDISLEGVKVVLDCANGATYKVAPIIFSELGAEVTAIHCSPNGTNINDHCGSQYTSDLRAKVVETGAVIGLAFDGDGDRLIAVDEKGNELSGDHIMAICGKFYKERGRLKNNLLISTIMSNFGFSSALTELQIEELQSDVGDRYVLEMMKDKDAILGGEASGHMIFLDHHTTGDGIISAMQLLAALQYSGLPLSELSQVMTMAPQRMINVDVREKPPIDQVPKLQAAIATAQEELSDQGRVLIRYSGTQAMCRVMVEGPTEEMTNRICEQLADEVRCLLA